MLTLAVMQALMGYTNETQWLRYARKNLLPMFPSGRADSRRNGSFVATRPRPRS